jgi:hypothetical protein
MSQSVRYQNSGNEERDVYLLGCVVCHGCQAVERGPVTQWGVAGSRGIDGTGFGVERLGDSIKASRRNRGIQRGRREKVDGPENG